MIPIGKYDARNLQDAQTFSVERSKRALEVVSQELGVPEFADRFAEVRHRNELMSQLQAISTSEKFDVLIDTLEMLRKAFSSIVTNYTQLFFGKKHSYCSDHVVNSTKNFPSP